MANTQLVVKYKKTDATFDTAAEANLNRFNGFPAVLESSRTANETMLADGTLVVPNLIDWDQATFVLSLTKIISNIDNYNTVWGAVKPEVEAASTANGWTMISQDVTLI